MKKYTNVNSTFSVLASLRGQKRELYSSYMGVPPPPPKKKKKKKFAVLNKQGLHQHKTC